MNAARAGTIALLCSGLLLHGCDGGSEEPGPNPPPPVPVDAWTLSGTVVFPADETATQLKLVATKNLLSYDTAAFESDPVALTLEGTPPTATFTLAIDTTRVTSAGYVDLMIWRDANGDGMRAISEPMRGMDPVSGSEVWCNASGCTTVASFSHLAKGASGYSSVDGAWTIATTGWYWDKGCGSHACAQLVVGPLTGARIGYWEYDGAIVPAP